MCYCPTPTLHLKLSPHRRLCAFFRFSKKHHLVCFLSLLNYGDIGSVLINHLHIVIPLSYPCYYTNLCPRKPQKPVHTHTHTHTHRLTLSHTHTHTLHWPLGNTPASMNVAMMKLAITKRKTIPTHGGKTGDTFSTSHGHLRGSDTETLKISRTLHLLMSSVIWLIV